jgi:hypothetical protein
MINRRNTMNFKLSSTEKDALIIHGLFAILCIIILILPIKIGAGVKLFILVIVYNIVMAGYGILKKDNQWYGIWLFSLILIPLSFQDGTNPRPIG